MPNERAFEVDITKIVVEKTRGRKKLEKLEDLSESIKKLGLIHPIVVSKDEKKEGFYKLIAGERRLRACYLLAISN